MRSLRIFTASWFFPPNTSSEGIVTYKLLRNSCHTYDVVCSSSRQWGYDSFFETNSANINVYPVDTCDLELWKDETVRLFEKLHAQRPYDAVMTRSMPSESLLVGLAIKKAHPDICWICSLADPVGNNPYWRTAIEDLGVLPSGIRKKALHDLALTKEEWRMPWTSYPNSTLSSLFFWKDIQDQALRYADMLITPSARQRDFMDPDGVGKNKFMVVPHTFDEDLYPGKDGKTSTAEESLPELQRDGRIHLLFTGYSDKLRSIEPFVTAARQIADRSSGLAEKICIHFFGNYPDRIPELAREYGVEDCFDFSGNVSYPGSLSLMKSADWLVHIDAWFEELASSGGSIFFAGKLADYMGAGKPVLALTGKGSPASEIVSRYGGVVCDPREPGALAEAIEDIVSGKADPSVNAAYRSEFDAKKAAKCFDEAVDKLTAEFSVTTGTDGITLPERRPADQTGASAETKNTEKPRRLLRSERLSRLLHSQLFVNSLSVRFLHNQKTKNGLIYRLLRK